MAAESVVTTCFRHPQVESYVRCTRCDRFICPSCMRDASVGHQCVDCVKEGARSIRQARTVFGGRIAAVPLVTYVLVGLNVVAYLVELARPSFEYRFAMLGTTPAGYVPQGVAHGDWYRLLTGAFLHLTPGEGTFGITHILFNMVALWNIGRVVETQLGRVRYLALYLLSALGSSVLELLLIPESYTVGASGAIFGLGAAYWVMGRRLGHDMREVNRYMAGLLLWLVISAGLTSWQGHLGGLLAGAVVTLAYAYAPRDARRALVQAGVCVALLALLVALAWLKAASLTA
ncbi:rhomboid family intramembrane serine protease [Streptomyces griseofuscus]|uniref:rhomboid family intramembrane serine protease n=1 Tax=Streptomyces TaxID=1883 RepID=UPI00081D565D|nr:MULTISPECIES: rhomboid family intramembrane serine protease [unclassified Streptomyces]MBJ7000588.1 rhomboid family intramembrane serine protease [Streptomyces sp. CRPSP2-6A1]MYQ95812.1 rhomboid family intramembrane serine protease [Streptomyces sp. SID4946]SCF76722.1 Membrane associated serine protease, rhomboid family [Streptomyces sp. LamerLS-31b]SCF97727.1 Membrane associated serine protease, rhomboid family [Streptomyces sp. DconLS]